MSRLQRRFTAWLACFAILMVSLAPSISHAVAAASDPAAVWTEICTSTGLKSVKVTDNEASKTLSSSRHASHYEDCPFCRIDLDTFTAPPSSASTSWAAPNVPTAAAFLHATPRLLLSVWVTPPSHAPPAHS